MKNKECPICGKFFTQKIGTIHSAVRPINNTLSQGKKNPKGQFKEAIPEVRKIPAPQKTPDPLQDIPKEKITGLLKEG